MLSRIPNTTELDSLQNIQLVTLTQVGESKHSESRRCRFLFSSCLCTIAEGCNKSPYLSGTQVTVIRTFRNLETLNPQMSNPFSRLFRQVPLIMETIILIRPHLLPNTGVTRPFRLVIYSSSPRFGTVSGRVHYFILVNG